VQSGAGLARIAEGVGASELDQTPGRRDSHRSAVGRESRFATVARFAHRVGKLLAERDPENLTREFHKVDRRGRILVDTGRNDYSATFAAAYTVRARPGAPVSAPCTWEEVERDEVSPRTFTIRNMAQRVANVGDLWADLLKTKRSTKTADGALVQML